MFNYDLPWNPMRVEQRIGRLDRFGQESALIHISNLIVGDTIEERIFYRLYERIRIFESSIGDLEAILGEVETDLARLQAEALSGRLNDAEIERRRNLTPTPSCAASRKTNALRAKADSSFPTTMSF